MFFVFSLRTMSSGEWSLCLLLFYCHTIISIAIQNATINTTSIWTIPPTTTVPTTTEFHTTPQSSFEYYTTPYPVLPNDTSTINVTLHFQMDIDSISMDNDLLMELTAIFESVLIKAAHSKGYSQDDDILYLQPLSDVTTLNTSNGTVYLQWTIIILIPEDEGIVIVLSEYLESTKFIKQFNDNLGDVADAIELIKTHRLLINSPLTTSTTTATTITTTDDFGTSLDITEMEGVKYVLPDHLRRFMLLYVSLFCLVSISVCCFGGWMCTTRCVGKETFGATTVVKEDHEEDKFESDDDKVLNGDVKEDKIYINASPKNTNGINKWEDIDKVDAEYMMKAFDDDETLQQNWFKYTTDSDNANSDEIQLINVSTREPQDDALSLNEKSKIHSMFDED
eukprot:67124_1